VRSFWPEWLSLRQEKPSLLRSFRAMRVTSHAVPCSRSVNTGASGGQILPSSLSNPAPYTPLGGTLRAFCIAQSRNARAVAQCVSHLVRLSVFGHLCLSIAGSTLCLSSHLSWWPAGTHGGVPPGYVARLVSRRQTRLGRRLFVSPPGGR
jgi:hypothetical protein